MKNLLFLLLCCPFLLKAQFLKSYLLYFSSGSSTLTAGHKQQLDSVIGTLNNIPEAFYVEVKGHTDNAGSKELNIGLSKDRAQHVLAYLKQKEFRVIPASVSYYDYTAPVAENTPEAMWQNRRVEIRFYLRKIDMAKSLGVKDAVARNYKFNEDEGGTISYDSTKITIAPNSFIYKDGREVKGGIDILYQEYRTPADFILSGIPMSVKQGDKVQHFNSGGMFNITAFQNGEELTLKKETGKTIQIDFPLQEVPDLNFYQLDTAAHAWGHAIAPLTDAHGNVLPGFVAGSSNANRKYKKTEDLPDYNSFLQCSQNDPCGKADYAIKKLKYFVTHEEPIRQNQAFKFIRNADVDFQSPWYKLVIDTIARKFTFEPANKNSKLGSLGNYEWSYDGSKTGRGLLKGYRNGCSFVKITHKGKNKFRIRIEGAIYDVTGVPKGVTGSEAKINRIIRKNTRAYVKYTHKVDDQLDKTEQDFYKRTGLKEPDLQNYYSDSLSCINYFFKALVTTDADSMPHDMGEFNLHKDELKKKLENLSSPFPCSALKKMIRQRDSINAANMRRMDSISRVYWRAQDSINRILWRKQDSMRTQRNDIFAKFNLNVPGSYNADAVKNISNPGEINAAYITQSGKELKIISIYLNLAGLNGIINYNGIYGYGPYHFVYGKKDRTMLVAVDEHEHSYYCSPEEFEAVIAAAKGKNATFVLKELKGLSTTANLQQVMLK